MIRVGTNTHAEAFRIFRKLALENGSRGLVAFVNARGDVGVYSVTDERYRRCKNDPDWVRNNLIGVYEWGCSMEHILGDILAMSAA